MDRSLESELTELLANGDKIQAITRFREETGASLADAKEAVEALETGDLPVKQTSVTDSDLTSHVVSLLERGEKLEAVKYYREQVGTGLKDAKEAVETIAEQHGIPSSSGAGCFGMFLLLLSGTALAWLV